MNIETKKLMENAKKKFVKKILKHHNYNGNEILEDRTTGYRYSAEEWAIDTFNNIYGHGSVAWIGLEYEGKNHEDILLDMFGSLVLIESIEN